MHATRRLIILTALVAPAAFADGGAAPRSDAPALFGPLYVSPAQQAATSAPRVEAALLYLQETSTDKETFGSSTSKTETTSSGIELAVGAVAPVAARLKVGVAAFYSPLSLKFSFSDSSPNSTSDTTKEDLTLTAAAPLIAYDLGNGVALGAEYLYEDLEAKLKGGGVSDSSDIWGMRAKFGIQAKPSQALTLGLAYETRERKLELPPSMIVYGDFLLKGLGQLGLVLSYRFNEDTNGNDDNGPSNAADAVAHLALDLGRQDRLVLTAGYLPRSSVLEPSRLSVLRAAGYGVRLGVEFEKALESGATAAVGLSYDKLGSSVGSKTEASGFQPSVRFATAI